MLFGGPPCQGFSLIGHRVIDDPRNELVFHFLRMVEELQPRMFVMENVPGMVTGKHTELLDELLEGFVAAGYNVRLPYKVLNAASYGVPQDRRRLFILGARRGMALPDYPEPITRRRVNGKSNGHGTLGLLDLPECPSVADALADLPDIEEFDDLLATDELHGIRLGAGSAYAKTLRGSRVSPNDFSHPREATGRVLSGCLRARHTELSRTRFATTPPGSTEPVSRFLKLALDGMCNTLRAGTGSDRGAFSAPRPIHPLYPRCISVREAARLHSYPDWFRFHRTIWHGFRQIGNSVPPLLARAVANEVASALGVQPVRPTDRLPLGDPKLAMFDMSDAAAYFGVSRHVIPPRQRAATATA